jgi:hypothetical protein
VNGVQEIARERLRQQLPEGKIEVQARRGSATPGGRYSGEGYFVDHDDRHTDKELARNAVSCLESYLLGRHYEAGPSADKWGLGRKHNGDPRRLLIIAGALISAEIDRFDRAVEIAKNCPGCAKQVGAPLPYNGLTPDAD